MNQRLTASQAEKTKKITMIGLMTAVTCIPRLCHFIENESPRNVVFISISGRFALK